MDRATLAAEKVKRAIAAETARCGSACTPNCGAVAHARGAARSDNPHAPGTVEAEDWDIDWRAAEWEAQRAEIMQLRAQVAALQARTVAREGEPAPATLCRLIEELYDRRLPGTKESLDALRRLVRDIDDAIGGCYVAIDAARPDLAQMSVAEVSQYIQDAAAGVLGRERVDEILRAEEERRRRAEAVTEELPLVDAREVA